MFGEKIGVSREWYEKSIELRKVLERCFVDDEYLHARLREKERKETAKKIFKRLVGYKFDDDGWSWSVSIEDIAPLAKEFGVEVEE